jgi:Lon protease-like protein
LFVGRPKSIKALEAAMESERRIMLVAQKAAAKDDPVVTDMFDVGCVSTILQMLKLPDGTVKVLVEGHQRATVNKIVEGDTFFSANVTPVEAAPDSPAARAGKASEIEALRRAVMQQFDQYVKLNKKIPPEILTSISSIDDAGRLADTIAAHLPLKLDNKQAVLSLSAVKERLENLFEQIEREVDILNVDKKIRGRVKRQMEKNQRDFYLNEQVKAIQKELGEGEDGADIDEIEKKIKAAKMPKDALKKAEAELKKLKLMSPMSAEAAVVRNYIDVLAGLPWASKTKIKHDLGNAENVLNEDHFGLDKVKDRILEYLAVQQRVDKVKAPILCLVGPPGVGKTSLGQSIAKATGRKYVRVALGGMRDEAEIRGHRRTYIGAMPGKVLQSLSKVGTRNPLFLLDEIDKLGTDFRGDPSSALLEVLDPEQNHKFGDHYVEVDFDLSDVMFVATSNSMNIPPALLDRMEVIRLSGYTEDEKVNIAIALPAAQAAQEQRRQGRGDAGRGSGRARHRALLHPRGGCALPRTGTLQDLPQGRQGSATEEDEAPVEVTVDNLQRVSRGPQVHLRPRRGPEPGGAGGRPGLDRSRRRPADDRGGPDARQGCHHPHRLAGRCDEGVGRGGPHGRSQPVCPARHQGRCLREEGHPHPCAGRRHAEGRPECRRRDDHRVRVCADRYPGARRRRDDGRDHVAWRGHRDWRPEGETARGLAWRHQDGADPGGERQGSAGHPGERQERPGDRPGALDRQGAGDRAGPHAGSVAGRGSGRAHAGHRAGRQ